MTPDPNDASAIDALLTIHSECEMEDQELCRAIFNQTTRIEARDLGIESLLEVHGEQYGGADRELVESIRAATTRASAQVETVLPFHSRIAPFAKVAAIVVACCGGIVGIASMISIDDGTTIVKNAPNEIQTPAMTVNIVHSRKPITDPAPRPVTLARATRNEQIPTPTLVAAATDFISTIDFELSDPALSFTRPFATGPSTEILANRPDRSAPLEESARSDSSELYAVENSRKALAVVNGSIISAEDRASYQAMQLAAIPDELALEKLIDERLLLAEFRRRGGAVTSDFVDATLSQFIEGSFGSDVEAFHRDIQSRGLTERSFKRMLEKEIAVRALLASDPMLASNLRADAQILRAK